MKSRHIKVCYFSDFQTVWNVFGWLHTFFADFVFCEKGFHEKTFFLHFFADFRALLQQPASLSISFVTRKKYLLMVKGSNFLTFWIILLLTLWAVQSLSAFHFPMWSLYVCILDTFFDKFWQVSNVYRRFYGHFLWD